MSQCVATFLAVAAVTRAGFLSHFRHLNDGGKVADNGPMAKYPSLVAHKIPHEIQYTDKLVKLLMRIAQTKPYLEEYLGQPVELQLLRKAKIRAITFSNQIEGNKLEERGVTQIIDGKDTPSTDKDVIEVRNYRDALEYAETLAGEKSRFKQRDLCDLQKLVTRNVLLDRKQSETLRSIQANIVDADTGKKIDDCPQPHHLSQLMAELWGWLEKHVDTDPFVKAFAFHYIAVAIHPFANGNGRSMRLAQHLLLLKAGEKIARLVSSESVIMATRDRYYSSIRQCKAIGSLNPIVEYLVIEKWRQFYNTKRPHSSLGYRPPAPVAVLPKDFRLVG
jgi:Fic family protein